MGLPLANLPGIGRRAPRQQSALDVRRPFSDRSRQSSGVEAVATRIDPESCAAVRKGDSAASVGECIGQPLSLAKIHILGADAVAKAEGNMYDAPTRASGQPGVVEEPGMCRSFLGGNREIPRPTNRSKAARSASGRRGAITDDERTREVRLCRSSWEVGEQGRAIGCGTDGAKGRGQGKCGPAKHAPGTEPGKACHRRRKAYDKQQGKGRGNGSPRSSTTSVLISFGSRSFG